MNSLDAIVATLQEHFAIKGFYSKGTKATYVKDIFTSPKYIFTFTFYPTQQIWPTVSTIKTNAFFYSHDVKNIFVHSSASGQKA